MRVFIGTSGYSYKEWKGSFYPDKIAAGDMLGYYGTRFRSVEINNTFYRMPRETTLVQWSEQVPDEFQFALKASRRITHQKLLVGADEELSYFLRTSSVLGDKLGPTLFQLPPHFEKDVTRLRDFLEMLPQRWRAAVEFRNQTWFVDETYELLRSKGLGLVFSETDDGKVEPELVATTGFGYLRLRKENYGSKELAAWAERIKAQPWNDVYVFFKHEGKGSAPQLAEDFSKLLQ